MTVEAEFAAGNLYNSTLNAANTEFALAKGQAEVDYYLQSNQAELQYLAGESADYVNYQNAINTAQKAYDAEQCRLLGVSKATKTDQTVYDPTYGSGSLLIKVADEAPVELSIYGQEMDVMVMHRKLTSEIEQGNTLANPKFLEDSKLQRFDFVVANPLFSWKAWTNSINTIDDDFSRFGYGVRKLGRLFDQTSSTGTPRGKVFGHLFPRVSRSHEPDQGFEDTAVGRSWTPSLGTDLENGEEMFDPIPIGVIQFPSDFFTAFRFSMRHGDLLSWSQFSINSNFQKRLILPFKRF